MHKSLAEMGVVRASDVSKRERERGGRGERPLSKRGESLSDGQNDDFLRTSFGLKDSKNAWNI